MKIITALCIYVCISLFSTSVNAQEKNTYKNISKLTTSHSYTEVINIYNNNAEKLHTLTGDSLIWVKFRVSRAYFNIGDVETASQIVQSIISDSSEVSSKDLQLRIRLFWAHILSNQSQYHQAIEEFNRVELLLQALINQNKAIGNQKELNFALEKLTTNYINKANSYYYLGDLDNYKEFTYQAYHLSNKVRTSDNPETANNAYRQHLIASRNLIEYYEIIEDWPKVIALLEEYEQNLITAASNNSKILPSTADEISRYQLRRAVYLKNATQNTEESLQLLDKIIIQVSSTQNYDIFEDAIYEKINTLFITKQFPQLEAFFKRLMNDPMVNRNKNLRALLIARKLQYYLLEDKNTEAQITYKKLQLITLDQVNTKMQASITHSLIMYHTKNKEAYTARLLLQNLIKENEGTELNPKSKNINTELISLYQKYKYQTDPSRTFDEVITIILKDYNEQKVKEWIYKSSTKHPYTSLGKIMILLTIITSVGFYFFKPRRFKMLSSESYQKFKTELNENY